MDGAGARKEWCVQRPGDGIAGGLQACSEEHAKLASQQLIAERLLSHRISQPQQVRRDSHVILCWLPARLHLLDECLSE